MAQRALHSFVAAFCAGDVCVCRQNASESEVCVYKLGPQQNNKQSKMYLCGGWCEVAIKKNCSNFAGN